jgi:hypothetical protein
MDVKRKRDGLKSLMLHAVYTQRFALAVLLLLLFAASIVLAQAPAPKSPARTGQPPSIGAHGAFLFVYRTPAHIRSSSPNVFEQVKIKITEYLAGQHVDVRKVEESDFSALAGENLQITGIADMPDVFQKARSVGASHVLFLTVDRPMSSWVKLKMQCFDFSGTALWEEVVANASALSGGIALKSALKKMEERLAVRIGQPGLIVEGSENTSTIQTAAGNAPGGLSAASAQPSEKESAGGEVAANQASATVEEGPVVLPEGTVVRLMLMQPVNSQKAKVGDKLEFRVLEDVKAGDLVVIPRKSAASGVVTELKAPGRRQRPGQITVKAETVLLINHETASLRGLRTLQSGNMNVSMETQTEIVDTIQGTAGLGLFFLPLFMLKHGEYVVLPAGMEFTAGLDHPVTMERAALMQLQSVQEKRHGNPVVTIYHLSKPPTDRPKFYCGKAEVARLQNGTAFPLTLPPGKYWFRCGSKKNALPLTLEEGGEYYLRVDSLMSGGNVHNPGFSQIIRVRDPDIGELEASEQAALDPKNIKDVSKIDAVLLSAVPE